MLLLVTFPRYNLYLPNHLNILVPNEPSYSKTGILANKVAKAVPEDVA